MTNKWERGRGTVKQTCLTNILIWPNIYIMRQISQKLDHLTYKIDTIFVVKMCKLMYD